MLRGVVKNVFWRQPGAAERPQSTGPKKQTGLAPPSRFGRLVRANQLIKGDHAGSDANAGVMMRDSLKPLRSIVHSCGPPFAPGVSRKNMRSEERRVGKE